jgi:WW domain
VWKSLFLNPHFSKRPRSSYHKKESYPRVTAVVVVCHFSAKRGLQFVVKPPHSLQTRAQKMTRGGVTLPPGWVEAIAPSNGRIYFANPTTGESSWTTPVPVQTGPADSGATMNHAVWMERDEEGNMDYPNLTPGMIADVCISQQKYSNIKKYVPLKPTNLDPKTSTTGPATTSYELRMAELYRKLHEVKPP